MKVKERLLGIWKGREEGEGGIKKGNRRGQCNQSTSNAHMEIS
jgi:hypothetical protein